MSVVLQNCAKSIRLYYTKHYTHEMPQVSNTVTLLTESLNVHQHTGDNSGTKRCSFRITRILFSFSGIFPVPSNYRNHSGYYIYRLLQRSKTLQSALTKYCMFCVILTTTTAILLHSTDRLTFVTQTLSEYTRDWNLILKLYLQECDYLNCSK